MPLSKRLGKITIFFSNHQISNNYPIIFSSDNHQHYASADKSILQNKYKQYEVKTIAYYLPKILYFCHKTL